MHFKIKIVFLLLLKKNIKTALERIEWEVGVLVNAFEAERARLRYVPRRAGGKCTSDALLYY